MDFRNAFNALWLIYLYVDRLCVCTSLFEWNNIISVYLFKDMRLYPSDNIDMAIPSALDDFKNFVVIMIINFILRYLFDNENLVCFVEASNGPENSSIIEVPFALLDLASLCRQQIGPQDCRPYQYSINRKY